MGSANALTLPQFLESDDRAHLLVKLRTLTREIERAFNSGGAAQTESGVWTLKSSPPDRNTGKTGDFALVPGADGAATIYYRGKEGWAEKGLIRSKDKGSEVKLSSSGKGTSLVNEGLSVKSITGSGLVEIKDNGQSIDVSALAEVDGGFFENRKDQILIQFARGVKKHLPLSAPIAEPFLTSDTFELYFGSGRGMKPLQIDVKNVGGLLVDGKLNPKLDPRGRNPHVTPVRDLRALHDLEAINGDVALVSNYDGESALAGYDGEQWIRLTSPTADRARMYLAGEDINAGSPVALSIEDSDDADSSDESTSIVVVAKDGTFDRYIGIAQKAAVGGGPVPVVPEGLAQLDDGQPDGQPEKDGFEFSPPPSLTPLEDVYADSNGRLTQEQPKGGGLLIGFAATENSIWVSRRADLRSAGGGVDVYGGSAGSFSTIRSLAGDETITISEKDDLISFSISTIDGDVVTLKVKRDVSDLADREIGVSTDTREAYVGSDDGAQPLQVDRDNVISIGCYRLPAGETLGGHRAVVARGGKWYLADPAAVNEASAIVAITQGAADAGEIVAARHAGFMSEPSWNWAEGLPIFFDSNGVLTQNVPVTGYLRVIAYPVSATQLAVDAEPPIILQE